MTDESLFWILALMMFIPILLDDLVSIYARYRKLKHVGKTEDK